MAVEKHGPITGVFKAVKRVLRCHPFSKGGYDPVV
jgi:putative component of membrane protein insertase Oxa1/YidC/SpoIIIJ protein YidD